MSDRERVLELEEELLLVRAHLARLDLRVSQPENEKKEEFVVVPSGPATAGSRARDVPSSSAPRVQVPTLDRERILRGIADWLQRCLVNQIYSKSGRHRLEERSECYLVIRDFYGQVHSPVIIRRTWDSTRPLVKPRGVFGQAVFIGLPFLEDAEFICEVGGFEFPKVRNYD